MSSKTLAVIGATGLFGKSISLAPLKLGHKVIAVTRSISDKAAIAAELEKAGAHVTSYPSDTRAFIAFVVSDGRKHHVDTVICAVNGAVIKAVEGHIINAAVKSGIVTRFCPDEFGVHTGAIPWGLAELFDDKKEKLELLHRSGLQWTAIFVGALFDYFLPSLKSGGGVVKTFGNKDAVFFANSLQDIGMMIALASVDERTVNKYVQFQVNSTTQSKNLEMVREIWPKHDFPERHLDEAELIRLMRDDKNNRFWFVVYAIYCLGRMNNLDFPATILGNEILPADYSITSIRECLLSPSFVFPDGVPEN
ncbi:Leucoanthocyanidin reductase [Perkinsus olseni]|uniref:Leucoanthocyanidin reductase n=1 Tax=Perkinsus olseni TaxID=32597 RepID=A0A7J6NW17_PEROL|nr:Leucoanthocyanidin reductase [Perkinsus olseni]KAF4703058.1 Leucoanthocyanidin reductase [Perkinsus olseni]